MVNLVQEKIKWSGKVLSIQPRTFVWRYKYDYRTHYHKGYNLFLEGQAIDINTQFCVAISEKQQQSLQFKIDDEVKGTAWTVMYEEKEYAKFYRAGALKVTKRAAPIICEPPPYIIAPPDLKTYQSRGARMLSRSSYNGKCFRCAWAAMAAVEIEYNFGLTKKYRLESFCYGPKSCQLYKMGRIRSVPHKNGSCQDDGALDEILTQDRDWDD